MDLKWWQLQETGDDDDDGGDDDDDKNRNWGRLGNMDIGPFGNRRHLNDNHHPLHHHHPHHHHRALVVKPAPSPSSSGPVAAQYVEALGEQLVEAQEGPGVPGAIMIMVMIIMLMIMTMMVIVFDIIMKP